MAEEVVKEEKINETPTEEKSKPVKKFRAGSISATVWKNSKVNGNGESFIAYAISLERNYTDKEGKWHTTNNMRINDLPKAELVCREAYEFLVTKKQQEVEE